MISTGATTGSAGTAAWARGRAGRCGSGPRTRAPRWSTTWCGAGPSFENATLEDFVLVRADGSVLFLLANVVDDMAQRISLVARARSTCPNTPKQQLLWAALGHEPPAWAHLSILVNEKRQKLSKRRDTRCRSRTSATRATCAEAMRNYLMLLGWSPRGDREIVPLGHGRQEFRLEDVNPSPAFFDVKKLRAFNGEYIRALPADEFSPACQPWLEPTRRAVAAGAFRPGGVRAAGAAGPDPGQRCCPEITAMVDFAFLAEPAIDEASWAKAMKEPGRSRSWPTLRRPTEAVPWQADDLRARLEQIGTSYGMSLGKTQAPVRVAVTGRTVGLPLFESLEVLGREQTLLRIQRARERLAGLM